MKEFEEFLKKQPVRRIPAAWRSELLPSERRASAVAEQQPWKIWLFRLALPAAAAVVVMATTLFFQKQEAASQIRTASAVIPRPRPLEETNRILNEKDVGVILGPDGRPYSVPYSVSQCTNVNRMSSEYVAHEDVIVYDFL